jgi:hypothetical protein
MKPGLELVLCITFISVHRVIVHLRWEAHKSNIFTVQRKDVPEQHNVQKTIKDPPISSGM